MTSGGTGWTQRADEDAGETSTVYGLTSAQVARDRAAASAPVPVAEAAGTGGRRRRGEPRDPVSQLRALREQASDLARKTAPAEAGPAAPATAGVAASAAATDTARRTESPGSPAPAAPAAGPAVRVGDVTAAAAAVQARTAARRAPRVRKARLRLVRLDPWSVMKISFLLSIAAGITLFVAVAVLWSILDAAGVFTTVGDVVTEVTSSEQSSGFDLQGFVSLSRVLGFTTLLAVVDVVLITALATLAAFVYNLAASLLGGLEVTLAEDD